ncbi:hypothetical protein DRJ00_08565 [Candidatus Aerophobetes bacterium]|uniref:Uncharacterized protein n=1 Tax=Aerophobetes bacterium TaxID=2030807 RepID=A0A497E253_UNCAE|nr:MAG: hypothetical protein DRJ00_08565 [Candidatus Aerophobetes bacterium]
MVTMKVTNIIKANLNHLMDHNQEWMRNIIPSSHTGQYKYNLISPHALHYQVIDLLTATSCPESCLRNGSEDPDQAHCRWYTG